MTIQEVAKNLSEIISTIDATSPDQEILSAASFVMGQTIANTEFTTANYYDDYPDLDWVESYAGSIEARDFVTRDDLMWLWWSLAERVKKFYAQVFEE